jgi:hypothetical protein
VVSRGSVGEMVICFARKPIRKALAKSSRKLRVRGKNPKVTARTYFAASYRTKV